nr:MAG TPA: hypothetical protein [Caudoviricetes sp.]DAX85171.1 MAG TPA: hypothetical protein [Caudoviricetes sp.]
MPRFLFLSIVGFTYLVKSFLHFLLTFIFLYNILYKKEGLS